MTDTARYMPGPEEAEDDARRLLLMVHELHRMGYQRLRIVPGMSPSGCHWRCTVVLAAAPEERVARYSTGEGRAYFGWEDAEADGPAELAEKFVERIPAQAARGHGPDEAYVRWYVDMLKQTAPLGLPITFADWDLPAGVVSTIGCKSDVVLPLPPAFVEAGRHG